MSGEREFLSGVIEGFYGPPWSAAERNQLFDRLKEGGHNTYLYAPKDDLKHRAIWRELYSPTEAVELTALIAACQQRGLDFVYAIGPGLDIQYSSSSDRESLQSRFDQIWQLGGRSFCLLFDDIPDRMDAADLARWGSLASAQCRLTNDLFEWVRNRTPHGRFFFCPTPYCGRMAKQQLGGAGYLETVGRELLAGIEVFWAGPEIISREITVAHVSELTAILRRKPVIWDNLHANDYDGRRFYCGPYAGRSVELRSSVAGILLNPNVEFPLNFVPLQTFAGYLRADAGWTPHSAYQSAMAAWLTRFESVGQPLRLADLILFGDCHYLPYEEGLTAEQLYQGLRELINSDPADWGESVNTVKVRVAQLREFCARLTELRDRPLFYALSRRAWELREELDLIERYITFKSRPENWTRPFRSDFHLPKTYRGGIIPRLQQLFVPLENEVLVPARSPEPIGGPSSF